MTIRALAVAALVLTAACSSTTDGDRVKQPATDFEARPLAEAARPVTTDTDCAHPKPATTDRRVVCDSAGKLVYVTGSAIFDANDIDTARAVPPSAGGGVQWSVAITLIPAASQRFADFTEAHNAGGGELGDPTGCGAAAQPCADYVAFIANGSAVSVPATLQPIPGPGVMISGGFTEASAKQLAVVLGG